MTAKHISFLLLIFVLIPNGISQTSSKYQHIDDYVVSFDSNASTPEKLARSLIKRKWTDDEKVRAVYGWIAKNIKYDLTMDTFNSQLNVTELEKIMETFSTRHGTCHNYSLLFQYMCKSIGIEAKVIKGYIKWLPSHVGKSSSRMDYHAWNMVKTNGKYHLIEVTWATASPRHFEYYFYPDPKRFIATHYSEGRDQLLSVPIKKEEFDKYPYISDCFFFEKKDNIFPKQGTIITNNGQIELKINYPDSLYLTPNIFMEDGLYYPPCTFKKVGQTLFLSVKIPEGEHVLALGLDCNSFLAYRVIYKDEDKSK
jgi:transglutaminase/protease-like cytokinesis protein 3